MDEESASDDQLLQDTLTVCAFCSKNSGEMIRFCNNCQNNYYVHKHCAERRAAETGQINCIAPCPAKYEIIYFNEDMDTAVVRRGASTFARCPPSPKFGAIYNCVVVKPVVLLAISCGALGLFLYTGSDYEKRRTLSELMHMLAIVCVVIACFLFERDMASYVTLYRSIMRVRTQMGMEISLILSTILLSLLVVKVFSGIIELDAIFGGWVFFTSVILVPCLLLYLLWTRVIIYLRAPRIKLAFNRVFDE
jgi:hypothetical protein